MSAAGSSSPYEREAWRPSAELVPEVAAPARFARRLSSSSAIARHLVLAYRPGSQSPDDLSAVADRVREIDPTIRTFIVPANQRNTLIRSMAAERPTLVVSAGRMRKFKPLRGRIYQGRPIAKVDEMHRLELAGLPMPLAALLTPDLRLDPAEWGEFVIVKPTDIKTSSRGRGIQLMRTRRVRYIAPGDYPEDHPGRLGPMIVQRYIDSGQSPGIYRVLTLMGEPLYAISIRGQDTAVDLAADDAAIERAVVATQAYVAPERVFVEEADVLALARAAHEAIPEIPLKGCDIIREAVTGKLYMLEVNSGGNTWHFSSGYFADLRRELGEDFVRAMHQQFDAFGTAARVLAARTIEEAE